MEDILQEERIDLGDKRLNKRYEKIQNATLQQPSYSIPAVFKNFHQTKAAYRFFDNPNVTPEKLLQHHYRTTFKRIQTIKEEKDILLLQDTTDLDYSKHKNKQGLGRTHLFIKKGLCVHPTIAVTPSRITLGLVRAKMWTRKEKSNQEKPQKLRERPIEKKESYRWLESIQTSQEVAKQCPEKTIFNIADREGDIYELLSSASQGEAKNFFFIVRAGQNRKTDTPERKLVETVDKAKSLGELSFRLKTKDLPHRIVRQNIKAKKLTIKSPKIAKKKSETSVYALLAEEMYPPKDQKPIKWLILTNYPIFDLKDAQKILTYYTIRWEIETFFRVLKSGCKVEDIRLMKLKRLQTALALFMIIASKIMLLLKLGREYPDIPCDLVFASFEWQAVYIATYHKKLPKAPPPLGEIITCIAQLGGYLNRKNDPPPGPQAMWIGMQQMRMLALGFELANTII